MSGECVFGCRHPLWGGAGECITNGPVDDSCVCDAGYASRDSFGNPSCVPFRVLVGLFTMVALFETMATTLILSHLAHHFLVLTTSARSVRKNVVRLRLMISASVSTGTAVVVFWSAVARGGSAPLWDGGGFFVIFGVTYTSGIFGALQLAELWLDHLPAPLVKAGGTLSKLKALAKERNLFAWGGFVSSVGVFILSLLSLVFGQGAVIHVLHLMMALSTTLLAIGFVSVAIFLTRAINSASAKSPQSWHARAKRKIRVEAGILVVACGAYASSAIVLQLSHGGRGTPILPFAAMLMVSAASQAAVVHTSKPHGGPGSASHSRVVSVSQVVSSRASAIVGMLSPRSKKAFGQASGTLAPRESSLWTPISSPCNPGGTVRGAAKNKIIPTISDDPIVPFVVDHSTQKASAESDSLHRLKAASKYNVESTVGSF